MSASNAVKSDTLSAQHDAKSQYHELVDHKAQPWKLNWPPQSVVETGEAHGVERGSIMLLDGSSGAAAVYPRVD